MTTDRPRRPPARTPDYTRILTRVEEGQGALNDRIDGLFDQLAKRFDRLEQNANQADQFRVKLSGEIQESRSELEDLKRIVTLHLAAHDTVTDARHDADEDAEGPSRRRRPKLTPLAFLAGLGAAAAWLATSGPAVLKFIAAIWRATLNSAEG